MAKNNVTDSIEKNQITNDMTQLALFIEQQDSIVANYMIVGSSRYEAEFNETTEEIESLLEHIFEQFRKEEEKAFLIERVIDNNERMKEIFTEEIASGEEVHDKLIYSRIQYGTRKSSSVALMNQLMDVIRDEQEVATKESSDSMNESLFYLVGANIVSITVGLLIMFILT